MLSCIIRAREGGKNGGKIQEAVGELLRGSIGDVVELVELFCLAIL